MQFTAFIYFTTLRNFEIIAKFLLYLNPIEIMSSSSRAGLLTFFKLMRKPIGSLLMTPLDLEREAFEPVAEPSCVELFLV